MSDFLYRHKLLTGLFVFWSMLVVSYAVFKVFNDVTVINAAINGALGIVFGLPTAAIAFWKWRNDKSNP